MGPPDLVASRIFCADFCAFGRDEFAGALGLEGLDNLRLRLLDRQRPGRLGSAQVKDVETIRHLQGIAVRFRRSELKSRRGKLRVRF